MTKATPKKHSPKRAPKPIDAKELVAQLLAAASERDSGYCSFCRCGRCSM
jgi:hypothetical protein